MASKLIWSPHALEDIEEIAEFISRDSIIYAESTISKIFETAQTLTKYSKSGRIVPETGAETIRELIVFQYRLIYEIKNDEIHVLEVIPKPPSYCGRLQRPQASLRCIDISPSDMSASRALPEDLFALPHGRNLVLG